MNLVYGVFSPLVLPLPGNGFPLYPFDPATGKVEGRGYHYHPAIQVVKFPGLGFVVTSCSDGDPRHLCAFSATTSVLASYPDLLLDSIRMGLAAFGGRSLNFREALDLAQKLQPAREEVVVDPDPAQIGNLLLVTYGEVRMGSDGRLEREVVQKRY